MDLEGKDKWSFSDCIYFIVSEEWEYVDEESRRYEMVNSVG